MKAEMSDTLLKLILILYWSVVVALQLTFVLISQWCFSVVYWHPAVILLPIIIGCGFFLALMTAAVFLALVAAGMIPDDEYIETKVEEHKHE